MNDINKYPRLSWSSAVSGGSGSGKRKQSRTEAPCTLVFQIPLEDVFRFGAPLGHGHVLRNRRKYSSRNLPICDSCFEEHPSVNVCAGIYPICVGEDLSISFCFALSSLSQVVSLVSRVFYHLLVSLFKFFFRALEVKLA